MLNWPLDLEQHHTKQWRSPDKATFWLLLAVRRCSSEHNPTCVCVVLGEHLLGTSPFSYPVHGCLYLRYQLANSIGFLADIQNENENLFKIISGILPPAVSSLFGWLLPRIMRSLSRYQGAQTHSRLDRAVLARYFAFLVISQLIIFTLIGVVYRESQFMLRESRANSNVYRTRRCGYQGGECPQELPLHLARLAECVDHH